MRIGDLMPGLPSYRLIALCLTVLLCCVSCKSKGSVQSFAPGETASDFTLPLIGGTEQKLSDFRGKLVLLNFWASWCGPCIGELPALKKLHEKFEPRGFAVVSIGIDDDQPSLERFREQFGISFPIFLDGVGQVKARYKLSGVPESFILDREGKFVMIPDPGGGGPTVRIVGPRDWDKPAAIAVIEALL